MWEFILSRHGFDGTKNRIQSILVEGEYFFNARSAAYKEMERLGYPRYYEKGADCVYKLDYYGVAD